MSKRWTRLPSPRRAVVSAALLGASMLAIAGAPAGAQAAALPTLSVSLTKAAITVSGSTVSGAVNVVTTSEKGLKEPTPVLVLLKPGVSPEELFAFLKTKKAEDPNYVSKFGSIVFDAEARAGATTEAQTVLQPGAYAAVDIEGEGTATSNHTTFTVTSSPSPATLPTPGAVERTIEFGFKGPSTLHVGELVRFENEGFLVHMDIAFPTKSRKTALRAAHDLLIGREKAAGKLIAGPPFAFFGPLSSGGFMQETITAKAGWYVLACFMDTQDGRQHTQLGMERVIHIVK